MLDETNCKTEETGKLLGIRLEADSQAARVLIAEKN
jgi:hypothetical protein